MFLILFPDHPELFALVTEIEHTLDATIIPIGLSRKSVFHMHVLIILFNLRRPTLSPCRLPPIWSLTLPWNPEVTASYPLHFKEYFFSLSPLHRINDAETLAKTHNLLTFTFNLYSRVLHFILGTFYHLQCLGQSTNIPHHYRTKVFQETTQFMALLQTSDLPIIGITIITWPCDLN